MTTAAPEGKVEVLWDDGEFVLSRVRHSADRGPTLLVRPGAVPPTAASNARLEHAHALRGDVDAARAARPLELIDRRGELALRLDDPSGQVLATLLGKPWEVGPFLRVLAGVAGAISRLHRQGLAHKDVKPSNVLVEGIALLKLLASQAAISLENARLYMDLREAQAYLAEAQRLSATGSFGWRPASGEVVWSEETHRIFALDPATKPTVEFALSRAHPEDRDRLQALIGRAAREARDWDLEYRLVMPDGAVKHLHVVAQAVYDAATRDTEYVGAVMDVTAAKESRQALEKAYAEIQALKDRLQHENIVLREEIDKTSMFEEIVGTSVPLRTVLSHVSKVAPTDSTVLISGETGTGKELVARAIHKRSPRSSRAFVSVNCAAIPSSLIASELFGHEKGAFTGAVQRRHGRFELADGGTILLDEVGELPAETQMTLLRVLQEREFERVGGGVPIRVNVRVIAATNRDLEAAVADGTFRADLFYRLNVFPLEIPALRDRRADVPLLVEYFTHRYAARAGKKIRGISKETANLLQSYDWPGNIRELQNVIERAVIVSDSDSLSIDERWLSRRPVSAPKGAGPSVPTLATHEKDAIEAALRESRGRVSGPFGAAARLGLRSSTLESKIKALKIDKQRFKSP
jgi:transcriptional regulator with GAF, ATPase, and Fis domain